MADKYKEQIEEMNEWLESKGIKYFKAEEIVRGLDEGNKFPDKTLWDNALPSLKFLEKIRDKYGRIRINSGYRSPVYNKAVGGSKNSFHTQFMAFDIKPLHITVDSLFNIMLEMLPKDSWGLYKTKTFIHIDNRNLIYRG